MREITEQDGLRVVGAGVDSLYLAYAFDPAPAMTRAIERAKAAASTYRKAGFDPRTHEPLADDAEPVEAGGVLWTVRPYGASCAPYLAANDAYAQWAFNPGDTGNAPTLQVKVLSNALWRVEDGAERMVARCDALAHQLARGGVLERRYVQRIDIAADFQGWTPELADVEKMSAIGGPVAHRFQADDLAEGLISKLDPDNLKRTLLAYVRDDVQAWFRWRFTGLRIGSTSVVVRLYNKTAEIRVSGKKWFVHVWGNAGADYRPADDVWRLEVQVPWEWMKIARDDGLEKLETVEDVLRNIRPIWRTILTHKIRHTDANTTRLANARTSAPWQALTETDQIDGVTGEGHVTRIQQDKMTTHEAVPKLTGFLGKISANEDVKDLDDAILLAHDLIQASLEERGITFPELVKKKQDARARAVERETDADLERASIRRARERAREKVCELRVRTRWSRRAEQLAFKWSPQMRLPLGKEYA